MNYPLTHRHPRRGLKAAGARGFTLLEILVALGLGMLILLALTVLFSRNTSNQSELERTVRQVESARFALDTLAEDVMHAGYFGEFLPAPVNPGTWTRPDPCAIAVTAQGWNTELPPDPVTPTLAGINMPVPVQGIAANDNLTATCLANRLAGTEAIVVRRADTGAAITPAAADPDNLYIQVNRCEANFVPQPIRAAAGKSVTLNLQRPDCSTVNDSVRRLMQRSYYIAACNDCTANDGIPTLKRVEVIAGVQRTVSIAEGVENLQVEYGLDTNGDGVADNFLTTPGVAAIPVVPANDAWQNVVSVRLHVLARSTQPTAGYSDVRTYQVGPAVMLVTPGDGFKRTLVTSSVRLNNVGGRRE